MCSISSFQYKLNKSGNLDCPKCHTNRIQRLVVVTIISKQVVFWGQLIPHFLPPQNRTVTKEKIPQNFISSRNGPVKSIETRPGWKHLGVKSTLLHHWSEDYPTMKQRLYNLYMCCMQIWCRLLAVPSFMYTQKLCCTIHIPITNTFQCITAGYYGHDFSCALKWATRHWMKTFSPTMC